MIACRFADTPEEKARKLAKKAAMPPSKFSSFDILQSLAGAYPLSLDGMQPGLPAGFTSFSAAGIPDTTGEVLTLSVAPHEDITRHHSDHTLDCLHSKHCLQGTQKAVTVTASIWCTVRMGLTMH